MKMIASLLGILTALCFAGCIVESPREVRVSSGPPSVPVQEGVPYDDPGRGWYIEGYYAPGHVWVAPFWTEAMIIEVVGVINVRHNCLMPRNQIRIIT